MEWLIVLIFWCIDSVYLGLLDFLLLKKAKEEHPQFHPSFIAIASALMINFLVILSAYFFALLPGAGYIGYYLVLLVTLSMYVYIFKGIYNIQGLIAYIFGIIGLGFHLLFAEVIFPAVGI